MVLWLDLVQVSNVEIQVLVVSVEGYLQHHITSMSSDSSLNINTSGSLPSKRLYRCRKTSRKKEANLDNYETLQQVCCVGNIHQTRHVDPVSFYGPPFVLITGTAAPGGHHIVKPHINIDGDKPLALTSCMVISREYFSTCRMDLPIRLKQSVMVSGITKA